MLWKPVKKTYNQVFSLHADVSLHLTILTFFSLRTVSYKLEIQNLKNNLGRIMK